MKEFLFSGVPTGTLLSSAAFLIVFGIALKNGSLIISGIMHLIWTADRSSSYFVSRKRGEVMGTINTHIEEGDGLKVLRYGLGSIVLIIGIPSRKTI